jgi:hypothetical protein
MLGDGTFPLEEETHMSPDPAPAASTHGRHFAGVLSRYAPHFMLWGICFAIGLLLAILGLVRPSAGTLLPGALLLVGSFGCLIPLIVGLERDPSQAKITPEGLQWHDRQGEHRCRWEEITAVFREDRIINQTFRVKKLRVLQAPGQEATFDQCLSDYDRLANVVQGMATKHLVPAKRLQLANGGAEFGPVTIHRDSIGINAKKFPWPEIEQYTIFNGSLVVYPRSYKGIQCEEVSLSQVPNNLVLLQLLQELGQVPVPPQQSILFVGRK